MMKNIIEQKLNEIEKSENIKILHCVESGSRAWGFASPDSDYDVRFIYVRPKEYYLRLDKTRDVIEWQLDDTLDINGWDIQKVLQLLYKSNPTVYEWNNSPIVYRTTEEWKNLSGTLERFFSIKSGIYHYLNTAKSNYKGWENSETVKFKKYFYVLRPLLACRWMLSEGTPPPMLFTELAEKHLDISLKDDVEKLLDLKINSPEKEYGQRFAKLDEYILKSIAEFEETVHTLTEAEKGWDELNSVFLSLL